MRSAGHILVFMTITRKCPVCGVDHQVTIRDPVDYRKWQAGFLIQNAMPYLSAAEREILLTGTCDPCWQKTMKDEEDDEFTEEQIKAAIADEPWKDDYRKD